MKQPSAPRLGAHMSVAGGLPRSVDRAVMHGCEALQIFTRSSNQWRSRRLLPAEISLFRAKVEAARLYPVVSHASYLINLASPSRRLRARSLAAFADEIDRAEALGLFGVVIHPGAYTSGTKETGLTAVGEAVSCLLRARPKGRALILLEHTAGQGTSLGSTFDELAWIIRRLRHHRRVKICLDSCHLWAAGYDLSSDAGYCAMFQQFDRLLGIDRLALMHLSDSQAPCGSHVDRHAHIGRGAMGLDPFRRLLRDPALARVGMILETPKSRTRGRGSDEPDPLDVMNLETLKALRHKI